MSAGDGKSMTVTEQDEAKEWVDTNDNDSDSDNVKMEIVWPSVIRISIIHLVGFIGLFCFFFADRKTFAFTFVYWYMGGMGITAGCHRYFAHRSYKANMALHVMLTIFASMQFENSIFEWVRDHRVHHKFSETNADPHNAKRGFFFSHMGWLMVKKHPDVIRKGAGVSIEDLQQDKVVMFQHRHKYKFMFFFTFFLPSVLPWLLWDENFLVSYFVAVSRYVYVLHCTWTVNSLAHLFGMKPYDKNINPSENLFVSFFAGGEGYHNFHHVFPSDFSTSEHMFSLNITTMFIKAMEQIGWAYDLKKTSPEMVAARKKRTGHHHVH